ncbi:MAG: TlpA disulfide reductase family protein [Longimicrobiales bacterium]
MNIRSASLSIALVLTAAGNVGAQESAAGCVKAANMWFSQTYTKTPAAERGKSYSLLQTEARRAARECAEKLPLARTPTSELPSLVEYYSYVGDTTAARLTLDRALAATDMPPRARATTLNLAVSREIARAVGYFGLLNGAESYVSLIDAMPDSLDDVKIVTHQRMLGQYEYLDVADGLTTHATALIALGRKRSNKAVLVNAFSSLARASADKLHPEEALKILDDAEREIGPADVKGAFDDFRHRYALIGTQATPVTGKWWVNTPAIDEVTPGNGKVTLVEFTAHWCGPCKNSYPGIKKVAQHFAGQPFQGAMVTGIYGYLGAKRNLTPEQEVEADSEYFGTEHAVPFPVAINVNVPVSNPPKPREYPSPQVDRDYRVGGIPQIVIIDKRGVIRQIVTGWDQGNTERFTNYITQLLAEK